MIAELTTIVVAYEEENMSPEDIASDRDLDLLAVKSALMQGSAKYRKDCGQEDANSSELNFNNDDLKRVNETILSLALGAEDEHLRFKAATYVRDDKKGRKEVVKAIKESGTNIFFINQQIQKARQATARLINGSSNQKAINV